MLGFLSGIIAGVFLTLAVRVVLAGFFTIQQNERAVLSSFAGPSVSKAGRAWTRRCPNTSTKSSGSATATRCYASSVPAGRTSSGRGNEFTRLMSPSRRSTPPSTPRLLRRIITTPCSMQSPRTS